MQSYGFYDLHFDITCETFTLLRNSNSTSTLNLHYGFIPAEAYGTAVIARTAKNVLELGADIPLLMIILPAALAAFKRMGTIRTARS